jgi:tetratricopeptide (TPR) repeat protein
MFRAFVAAIFFAFVIIPGRAQTTQSTAASSAESVPPVTVQSAQGLAAEGRLEQAMVQLDHLAAQLPEPEGAERLRGIIFYQRDKFRDAIEAFNKAETQNPNDRIAMEMHGVSLFRLGHVSEAIPFLEKAHAAVTDSNIDPDYVLAVCYADVQRYDDSRHAFAAQFGFAPNSPQAYLLAGRQFLRRELRDEAGVEAAKALELDPTLPLAHELLGEVALSRGDVLGAIHELEAERTLNPLDPDLYDRLGDAYLRNGRYADAQQALDRAVLLEPNSTGPYILLGQTFLKLNDPIQALHYLDHAVRMDPSNYITHNLLGQAYKAIGQLAAANREFKTVVELQHRNDPKLAEK